MKLALASSLVEMGRLDPNGSFNWTSCLRPAAWYVRGMQAIAIDRESRDGSIANAFGIGPGDLYR